MSAILLLAIAVVLCFGAVLLFGPPYLPTMRGQITLALDLLDLKPGQRLLELGSGDGRVLQAAARRGLRVTGYEINPILVAISYVRTWRYRSKVRIIWGSYWQPWPSAEGIFTFMLPRYMGRLDAVIRERYPRGGVRLASFAFALPGKKPRTAQEGVFLYDYH